MSQRRLWLFLIPLLLLVCWLGSRQLNADSVWWDELASMRDAGLLHHSPDGLLDIWNRVGTGNPWHVPGFFMLLNAWSRLVGFDPAMLRAFALLAGLLAVAWTYRLGSELVSLRVGLYAAGVLGTSAFFVYYLHELRMYTLFALFTAFTLWVYLRIVRARHVTRWHWVGLFIGALGLLYTHYFAALLLGVIALYHLSLFITVRRSADSPSLVVGAKRAEPKSSAARPRRGVMGWGVPILFALAALHFLLWIPFLIDALGRASSADTLHERALTPLETIQQLGYLFSHGAELSLLVLLGAALVAARRSARVRRVWFFAFGLLAALLFANAIVQVMHGGRLRYLMALWPLMAILIAVGLDTLGRRYAWVLLGLWMIWGITNGSNTSFGDVDGTLPRFPAHRVAQLIQDQTLPSDVVVNFVADLAYRSSYIGALYYGNLPVNNAFIKGRADLGVDFAHLNGEEGDQISLQSVLGEERLWLATMPNRTTRAMRQLTRDVAQSHSQCTAIETPEVNISLYAIAPVCCLTDNPPLRLRFGDGISLVDGDAFPAEVGDTLPVTLMWAITGDIVPHMYSASVQIFDSDGNKVAQSDYGLEAQLFTCNQSRLDLSALPSGEYEARVMVYAWETGERLPGTILATGESGEMLSLGRFVKQL